MMMSPQSNPPEHWSHDDANTSCPKVTRQPPKSSSGVISVSVPLISMPDSCSETSPPPYSTQATFSTNAHHPLQNQNRTSYTEETAGQSALESKQQERQRPLLTYAPLEGEAKFAHPLTRTSAQVGRLRQNHWETTSSLGISLAEETPCNTPFNNGQSVDGTAPARDTPKPNYQQVMEEDLNKARGRLAHFSRLSSRTKGTDFNLAALTIRLLRIRFATIDDNDSILASLTELLQVNPELYRLLLSMTQTELRGLLQIYDTAKGELGDWLVTTGFPGFLTAEDQVSLLHLILRNTWVLILRFHRDLIRYGRSEVTQITLQVGSIRLSFLLLHHLIRARVAAEYITTSLIWLSRAVFAGVTCVVFLETGTCIPNCSTKKDLVG